jgi:hypothetical protein
MRRAIHRLIVWYLRKSGGAFHCFEYGPDGRYVAMFRDHEYGVAMRACKLWRTTADMPGGAK